MQSISPFQSVWGQMDNNQPMPTQQSIPATGIAPNPPLPGEDPMFDEYLRQAQASSARSQAIAEQLAQSQQGSIDNERKLLSQQELDANAYASMPLQKDLSPYAALLDSWNGTNLAKQYQPQETVSSRQAQMQALQAGLNKARGNISESELSLIKTRLNNAQMSETNARKILEAKMAKKGAKDQHKESFDIKTRLAEQKFRDKIGDSDKHLLGVKRFKSTVIALRDSISKNGLPLTGANLPDFRMLYTSAKLAGKDKEELGAITNADAELVSGLLGPYNTYEKMRQAIEGGDAGAIKALDHLVELTDQGWKSKIDHLRLLNPEPVALKVIDEFDKDYLTVKGASSAKAVSVDDGPPAGWNP